MKVLIVKPKEYVTFNGTFVPTPHAPRLEEIFLDMLQKGYAFVADVNGYLVFKKEDAA